MFLMLCDDTALWGTNLPTFLRNNQSVSICRVLYYDPAHNLINQKLK